MVHALVKAYDLPSLCSFEGVKFLQILRPTRATARDLSVYHSCDYLDYVLDAKNSLGHLSTSSPRASDTVAELGLEDVSMPYCLIPTVFSSQAHMLAVLRTARLSWAFLNTSSLSAVHHFLLPLL